VEEVAGGAARNSPFSIGDQPTPSPREENGLVLLILRVLAAPSTTRTEKAGGECAFGSMSGSGAEA